MPKNKRAWCSDGICIFLSCMTDMWKTRRIISHAARPITTLAINSHQWQTANNISMANHAKSGAEKCSTVLKSFFCCLCINYRQSKWCYVVFHEVFHRAKTREFICYQGVRLQWFFDQSSLLMLNANFKDSSITRNWLYPHFHDIELKLLKEFLR